MIRWESSTFRAINLQKSLVVDKQSTNVQIDFSGESEPKAMKTRPRFVSLEFQPVSSFNSRDNDKLSV